MLLRETSQLRTYLGADKTLRIRASLGPLATPDYSNDSYRQQTLFGDTELYQEERKLRDLCVNLAERFGVRIRLIGYLHDDSASAGKGYSKGAWQDRVNALRSTALQLGDSLEFAPAHRPSDVNTWSVADIAFIDSRKSNPSEARLYDRAHLETGGAAIHRANQLFDMEFDSLVSHAGGTQSAKAVILGHT